VPHAGSTGVRVLEHRIRGQEQGCSRPGEAVHHARSTGAPGDHRGLESIGMRTRLAAFIGAGLVGLACSSSSSGDNTSIQATWCGQGNPSGDFIFGPNGACFYRLVLPSGSICGSQCSYQLSGNALTITTTSTPDGGAGTGQDGGTATTTCSYTLTFSNGGNSLEFKSDGGQAGCPSLDITSDRVGLGTGRSCSFGC